jgi:hypothetical protein
LWRPAWSVCASHRGRVRAEARHDRIPVLLKPSQFDDWLAGKSGKEVLVPAAEDFLQTWPVSKRVNSSRGHDNDHAHREDLTSHCLQAGCCERSSHSSIGRSSAVGTSRVGASETVCSNRSTLITFSEPTIGSKASGLNTQIFNPLPTELPNRTPSTRLAAPRPQLVESGSIVESDPAERVFA